MICIIWTKKATNFPTALLRVDVFGKKYFSLWLKYVLVLSYVLVVEFWFYYYWYVHYFCWFCFCLWMLCSWEVCYYSHDVIMAKEIEIKLCALNSSISYMLGQDRVPDEKWTPAVTNKQSFGFPGDLRTILKHSEVSSNLSWWIWFIYTPNAIWHSLLCFPLPSGHVFVGHAINQIDNLLYLYDVFIHTGEKF